ncbi:MAG: hypothetical protein ACTSV5_01920 [Promethearchaeota archaeon]
MEEEELKPYYIAKYASKELIVEEMVLSKGAAKSYYLEKYVHYPIRLKLKVVFTKLFFAITFGILPVLPLLTYLEIINLIAQGSPSIEVVFFIGGLLFSFYFCLQFLNFFIMGMLDTAMIISGKIFEWLETLPIPRKKFLRIEYLTLFRSYDLPIIVLIFAFPITMFIGSQNILIFLVCLVISIVNTVLSFNILLIFGERINRILDINDTSSKKNLVIRLINILSYIFIIISSYVLIQWFFSSVDTFYTIFTASEYQSIINNILSLIPFPFNSSFLISLFIAFNQSSLQLWISTLIGFALLIIITYWISRKAFKAIERISISKLKAMNVIKSNQSSQLEVIVKIKSSRPFIAYLRKDLHIITRDLKVFMSIILPILLSFIFVITFGIKNIGAISLIDRGFFQNWMGILTFSPVLSGLIVYGLTNIENFGESILTVLPIIPRNQAKPKLLLIYFIQTCATLAPSLMYIFSPNFIAIFINFLFTLPFAWLFLIMIFILRINFFGKKRPKFYVLEDFSPKNRIYKWTLTITVPYIIYFWMIPFGINFLYYQNNEGMMILFWGIVIVGFLVSLTIFNILLPVYQKEPINKWTDFSKTFFQGKILKEDIIPTSFSKHIWITIILLIIINFILFLLAVFAFSMLNSLIDPFYFYFQYTLIEHLKTLILIILIILVPNILYASIFFYVIPKHVGVPYGKQPFNQYLDCIGLTWLKNILTKKNIITIIVIVPSILVFYLICQEFSGLGSLNYYNILILVNLSSFLSFCIWNEILHHGIFLTMLASKYSKKWSLVLLNTSIIIFIKAFIYFFPLFSSFNQFDSTFYYISLFLFDVFCSSIISLILGYVYLKSGSLLSSIFSTLILSIFLPISFFVPFLPLNLFVYPIF